MPAPQQELAGDLAVDRVVLHQQQVGSAQAAGRRGRAVRAAYAWHARRRSARRRALERAARSAKRLPRARRAVDADARRPSCSHQLAADRQAQAGAAVAPAWSTRRPARTAGTARAAARRACRCRCRAPRSAAATASPRRARPRRRPTHDLAALGELHRVADQVEQHLAAAATGRPRSAPGSCGGMREHAAPGPCSSAFRPTTSATLSTHVAEVERDRLHVELAGLDLREVEDVVDDAEQRFGRRRAPSARSRAAAASRPLCSARCDMPRMRVHRRADLVAHVGEELALGLVRRLGRPGAPRGRSRPACAAVMSRAMPTVPTTLPSPSSSAVLMVSISETLPSALA